MTSNQSLNAPSSVPVPFTVSDTIRQLLTALDIKVDPQQYPSPDEFVRALPEGKLKRILYHRRYKAEEGKPLWFFAKRAGLPVETVTKEVGELAKSLSAPVTNCDQCKTQINATHFVCLACKNYVLCESCEVNNQHQAATNENHIFAKVGAPYALKLRKIVKERKQAWRAEHGCRNEGESPCGRMRRKWLKKQHGHCRHKNPKESLPFSDSEPAPSEHNPCHEQARNAHSDALHHPHASQPHPHIQGFHQHDFQHPCNPHHLQRHHSYHQHGIQHPHFHLNHGHHPAQPNHSHCPQHPFQSHRGIGCRRNGHFARSVAANPMHVQVKSPCVSFGVAPEVIDIPESIHRHGKYHPYHLTKGARCGKHGRGNRMRRHEKYQKRFDHEDSSDEESFQMMFIQQQLAEIQNTLSEM